MVMFVSIDDIPNKKSFEQDLAAQIDGGRTVSLIFVDLDGFKQVNDQHGHPEGDKCLMESAAAMAKVIEGKGRLYRMGGDEFCIILPNRSGPDAAVDAEQVRLSIDRLKPFGGTSKVTASMGVVTSCAKLTDAKDLIAAADGAMYVSKWTTKNCVTTWPPSDTARVRADLAKLNSRMGSLQAQLADQDKRNTDEKQRRQIIVERLAKLLQQGREIRDKVEYNNLSVQEVANWKQRVERYLMEDLGEPFAVRFRSSIHQVTQYPQNMVAAMRVPWAGLTECMMMLNDFMAEHRL
jgi:diguanylate cyclase (GGDEF)-like protein